MDKFGKLVVAEVVDTAIYKKLATTFTVNKTKKVMKNSFIGVI